jgi:O-antigen/teichoic acid export membrane protein
MSRNFTALLSDGILYTLLNILNRAIPFLLLPVILNYISTKDFGLYSYFILVETFLIPLVSLNMSAGYPAHFFSKKFSDTDYLSTVLFSIVIWSISFLTFYLVSSSLITSLVGLSFKFVCLAIVSASFNSVISTCLNLFRLEKRLWMYAVLSILQSIVMFTLVFSFVKYYRGFESIIIARFYAYLLFFIIIFLSLIYRKAIVLKFDIHIFKTILKFGFPTVFYSLSAFIFLNSDRYFIKDLLGPEYLGFYSAIFQICAIMSIFSSSLSAAWIPWLFENLNKNMDSINVFIVKVSYFLIALVFLFGITLFFVLPILVEYFLPKTYYDYTFLGFPIIFGFVFETIYLIVSPYVYYVGKTKYNAYVGFILAPFNIILNLILIPNYGLLGAAISTMFSWIFLALFFLYFSSKVYSMPWFYFIKSNRNEGN